MSMIHKPRNVAMSIESLEARAWRAANDLQSPVDQQVRVCRTTTKTGT